MSRKLKMDMAPGVNSIVMTSGLFKNLNHIFFFLHKVATRMSSGSWVTMALVDLMKAMDFPSEKYTDLFICEVSPAVKSSGFRSKSPVVNW